MKKKILMIGCIVALIGITVIAPLSYTFMKSYIAYLEFCKAHEMEIKNTEIAIEWCAEQGIGCGCGCAFTYECLPRYREAHNFSKEVFPCAICSNEGFECGII